MILSDVFERFSQDAPLSVMAQGIMENALNPQILDQLFEDVAEQQFTHKLLFSTVVDLMSVVVCRIRPSIHAAFQARAETVGASIDAVYDKLDGTETAVSAALVHAVAARLAPVIDAMGGGRPDWLPGYRIRILDGNHLPGTEHRLKELRTIRAGALPGHALVVLDPRLMLATDVVLCEDGHAQERSLLDQILAIVAAKDLWIADRNFCTTDFLFGIARRGGFFVIRQHASTLHWEFVGKRRACGRIETGKVFEQTIRATNDAGEILILRRVTVVLDKPTRDGETELHLLTNVPAKDARAKVDRRVVPAPLDDRDVPPGLPLKRQACIAGTGPPRISVTALLQLARWCQSRFGESLGQSTGGPPCPTPDAPPSPPRPRPTTTPRAADPSLVGPPPAEASGSPAGAQPDHRQGPPIRGAEGGRA